MPNYRKRHLTFREVGIPPHVKRRAILLTVLFFVFIIILFVTINFEGVARVDKLAEPTLPEVRLSCYGQEFSSLHGYREKMDGCYMRDAIVPLKKNRRVPIRILTDDADVEGISYEIHSMDSKHNISKEEITDFKTDKNGVIKIEPELTNLVEKGQEYLFTLTLLSNGEEIYYYTRMTLPSYKQVEGCINFAKKFSDTALSDDDSSISTYIEPTISAETDEDNLSEVNLHSSLTQVAWRNFSGKRVAKPDVDVVDIGDDYCAVSLHYQMKDTDEEPSLYNVVEYMRLRKGIERYYLLDYNRTMEKILIGSNITRKNNEINIGIRPTEMDYISNVTGTIAAFEQAGDLFLYEHSSQRVTRIFSFRGDPDDKKAAADSRRNYSEHGIRLLQIEENGSLDYCVYGYMNCGKHEGLCGINLYHYDAGRNLNEEQAFIASTKSYQVLSSSFADLIYENAGGEFYIMSDGTLEGVDLSTLKTRELNTGLKSQQFAASPSGRYITWIDDIDASNTMHVMDLENESTFDIKSDNKDELLRPLAYLGNDLVYGIVRKSDITKGLVGAAIYPMYKIVIRDTTSKDGPVQKTYEKKKKYVTDVSYNSYSITLSRVKKSNGSFKDADEDVIRASAGEQNREVEIERRPMENKGTETFIIMTSQEGEKEDAPVAFRDSKLVPAIRTRAIHVTPSETGEYFYVYVGSDVVYASTDPVKAIKRADKVSGIVVDNEQNYIWKREAPKDYASVEDYETNVNVKAKKNAYALDLTGLTLEQVLYFVGIGIPVYVDNGEALLPIIAYAPDTITLVHPDGEEEHLSFDEAADRFDSQGNIYVVYMDNLE